MKTIRLTDPDAAKMIRYVSARMLLANERMLMGKTVDERIRAGKWVVAWALVAGLEAPEYLKLRHRNAVMLAQATA